MEAIPARELVAVSGKILCCQCGTPIDPNPANLCVACLRTQVDITEGIPKQVSSLHQHYTLHPSGAVAAVSTKTLLIQSICLKCVSYQSEFHYCWDYANLEGLKSKIANYVYIYLLMKM